MHDLQRHFVDKILKQAWAHVHIVEWFQVLLCNLTSVIYLHTFKCIHIWFVSE